MAPSEVSDITKTQAGEDAEQEGSLQNLGGAGRVNEPLDLFHVQVCLFALLFIHTSLSIKARVEGNELLTDSKVKGGMQVANNAKAERQLRMQRDKLQAEGRAFRDEMETRQREYEKALGEVASSKEKAVMRQLEKAHIREDANDAFMQYIDGGIDGNLADIIGGFYGEGGLEKGFV